MLTDRRIWILMIPDFSIVIALYGLNLWLPQMVKAMGYTNIETGFVVALPYLLAAIAMVVLGCLERPQRPARALRRGRSLRGGHRHGGRGSGSLLMAW